MAIFRRFSVLLLPVSLMLILNSCASHHMASRSMTQALATPTEVVTIYWGQQEFELTHPVVEDEILSGRLFAIKQSRSQRPEYLGSLPEDFGGVREEDRVVANRVHVFVDSSFRLVESEDRVSGLEVSIPLKSVAKVQVREADVAGVIVKTFGAMVLVAGVGFLIILATKDSCPFIYVEDGDESVLVGEIYSGAIHPPLERHDYMALPVSGDGPCNLRITNEVLEIQHTNLTELMVFDHAVGERVLVDRHGVAYRIAAAQVPTTAQSYSGEDVRQLIEADDEVLFIEGGAGSATSGTDLDGMILTFARPQAASQVKLVINARNSSWLDHVLGVLFERMGDLFKPWQETQKKGSATGMRQWMLDQGLPLMVSLKTDDGWRYVDYFDLAGPIAQRDAVLAVDLAGVTGDEITVKLESGYRFWEIDSVLADFTPDTDLQAKSVSLTRAVTREGRDVTAALTSEDDTYLHQPDVGDETFLNFQLPPLAAGLSRSVILHSKGHYDILRSPQGQPDLAFVTSFKKPGRVAEYSRELYQVLSDVKGP